jgi:hypothetical protein
MLYTKKPITISAWKNNPEEALPDWLQTAYQEQKILLTKEGSIKIQTLEGEMTAQPGDWIIQGVIGELYPCKPEVFEATYSSGSNICTWYQEENESDLWLSNCGLYYTITEGFPSENEIKYCCKCGRPVEEIPWEIEVDRDE